MEHPDIPKSLAKDGTLRFVRLNEPRFKGWCLKWDELNSYLPITRLVTEPEIDPNGRKLRYLKALCEVEFRKRAERWMRLAERGGRRINFHSNVTECLNMALAWRKWGSNAL